MNTQTLLFIPVAYLIAIAIPLLATDLKEHRLPNKLVLPLFPIWLLTSITYVVLTADWWNALLMPLLLSVAYLLLGIVANYFDWIGMGDVKLITAMVLSLSGVSLFVLVVPFVAIAIAIPISLVLLMKQGRTLTLPLAPYIYAGYLILAGILFL
jgi:leader peptidase (prepilin peptidase)/N-methyltransferase